MSKRPRNTEKTKINPLRKLSNPANRFITYLQGEDDAGWKNTAFTRQFTLICGLILAATIISIANHTPSHELKLDPSYIGFNYLIFTLLKSPIAIVASGLVVMTFYISNYRARQQDEALALSRSQNNFANFFQHRTELKDVFKTIENKASEHRIFRSIQIDYGKLYTQIYPKSKLGDFSCLDTIIEFKAEYLDFFEVALINFYNCQIRLELDGDENKIQKELRDISDSIKNSAQEFAIKRGINLGFQLNHTLQSGLLQHYKAQIKQINATIVEIMHILVQHSFSKVCEGEFEELGATMSLEYHLEIKPDFETA